MLVALGIHILLNAVVKEFPPEDPTTTELRAYLEREASNWAIVHGFRYVAFACVVLFAAALFSRCVSRTTGSSLGWAVMGLLGTAIWVTNGVVTNGLEILAFIDDVRIAAQQELFWLLFDLTRVLFTAEIAAWSITIFGFSMAGWRSGAIPIWLCVLGFSAAAGDMASSVLVIPVMAGGWAAVLADLATIASLTWFLCMGILMMLVRSTQEDLTDVLDGRGTAAAADRLSDRSRNNHSDSGKGDAQRR